MPKRKKTDEPRIAYLKNIQNWKHLKSNVVVSSIQGLVHVADFGDEKYLVSLLNCSDKAIAGEALSTLSMHYPEIPYLNDRIVEFASTYSQYEEEENHLQVCAIFALERLATTDTSMFQALVEIAENYKNLQASSCVFSSPTSIPSAALSNNACAWEALARLCDEKMKGEESVELTWNPYSALSEQIRDRIREKCRKYRFG